MARSPAMKTAPLSNRPAKRRSARLNGQAVGQSQRAPVSPSKSAKVCGQWIFRTLRAGSQNPPDAMGIPFHAMDSPEQVLKKTARKHGAAPRMRRQGKWIKPRTKRCLIIRLPPELLQQIVAYIVPTETIFHVSPSEQWKLAAPAKAVTQMRIGPVAEHRFVPGEEALARSHLCAIARTCVAFNQAFNAVFYGRNQFAFNFEDHRHAMPRVDPALDPGPDAEAIQWSRAFTFASESPAAWPLTPRTASYVRDLVILGFTGPRHFYDSSFHSARRQVVSLVDTFGHQQRLQRLMIHLAVVPLNTPSKWWDSRCVRANQQGPAHPRLKIGLSIADARQDGKGLGARRYEVWKPFEALRGLDKVELYGNMSDEQAERLERIMTSARQSTG